MACNIITSKIDSILKEASAFFHKYGFRALRVADEEDKLVGFIPFRDVMNLGHLFLNSTKESQKKEIRPTQKMRQMHVLVNIFVESHFMDEVTQELAKISNVEEIYEVTGEFDIISLVSAVDIEEFRDTLKNKIMKIPGIRSTVSSIILKAHKGKECET